MAGDWIKLESVTPDKPEVIGIAHRLGIDQDAVTGKLCRLWIWADQQTFDGNAGGNGVSVTVAFVDRCTSVTGFADAMRSVGWLNVSDDGSLCFPNFDRHNGQTAKQRALTAKRVAKHKSKTGSKGNAKGNAASVTGALPREEKRRDKPLISPLDQIEYPPGFDIPAVRTAVTEWLAYKRDCGKSYKHPAKQISKLLKASRFQGNPAVFVAAVDNSIAQNYAGCFPESSNGKPQEPPKPAPQRPQF